ncbi:MAG TPA: acyl-CoA thioesterase [Symbiobacteriaceae bacterium]|nr:acyl-CoA thioesterase [Symbiobacteriaceae bacterium]
MKTPKPPRLSAVEMTEVILPNHANPLGNMLGGRVLHYIDMAAAVAAIRHAGFPCVTASFDSVDFLTPIHVGEACILRAKVTWTGRSSLEVYVEVLAENLMTGQRRHATTAFTTFVAIDPATGQPTEVPPVAPETEEETRMFETAATRRAGRLARRASRP